MHNQTRLLQLTTALLYFGPLMAGLGGYGWNVVPQFTAIFLLWQMILFPWFWPRDLSEWVHSEIWAAAMGRVLTQVLLVSFCFGFGRGMGGVMGFQPLLHPMMPIGLSFLAIPLSRLVMDAWRPVAEARAEAAAARAVAPPEPEVPPLSPTDAAVAELMALPVSARPEMIRPLLARLLDHPQAWQRLDALIVALDRVEKPRPTLRRELILWATDAYIVASGRTHQTVDSAFQLAAGDPALMRLFLPRALGLIAALPDRHDSFPSPRDLRDSIGKSLPSDIAKGLAELATLIDKATPPELRETDIDQMDTAIERRFAPKVSYA